MQNLQRRIHPRKHHASGMLLALRIEAQRTKEGKGDQEVAAKKAHRNDDTITMEE